MAPLLLDGAVAAVTGAGRGLGQVLATALAAAGARVLVNARRAEMAAATVAAIAAAGGTAAPWVDDVTRAGAAERMVTAARAAFGRLDILVNNAAVFGYHDFLGLDRATWDRAVATNLTAPFVLAQGLMRHAAGRGGGGAVLQVASVHAAIGEAGAAAQCATKAGLVGLTRALAAAGRPYAVRVNAIAPGAIAPAPDAAADAPSQGGIAQLAVLLVSPAAAAVTGAIVDAHGASRAVIGA